MSLVGDYTPRHQSSQLWNVYYVEEGFDVCRPAASLRPHHLGTAARGQLGQEGVGLWLG